MCGGGVNKLPCFCVWRWGKQAALFLCVEVRLVLLCTKEQITSAYTISASHHGSGSRGEELEEKDRGRQQQLCVKGSCHTRLGNWLPASGQWVVEACLCQ